MCRIINVTLRAMLQHRYMPKLYAVWVTLMVISILIHKVFKHKKMTFIFLRPNVHPTLLAQGAPYWILKVLLNGNSFMHWRLIRLLVWLTITMTLLRQQESNPKLFVLITQEIKLNGMFNIQAMKMMLLYNAKQAISWLGAAVVLNKVMIAWGLKWL